MSARERSRPPAVADPADPQPDELGFAPFQKMVQWFSPMELTRAGVKALLSSLFGAYADNRELQAVRDEIEPFSYADRDEIWIDYVADLGDGWDSTYAVARLLAEERLTVRGPGGASAVTERGHVLVMGGDQVYPTATKEEYANRLAGPYRAALPWVEPESAAPHLFAVPGNHDWYDGLTSFTRLFGQNRWIGGWKTRQTRSYFALGLPHDWWLWGIDVQLGSEIDLPQLAFFKALGAELARTVPGGVNVILCTAEPAWVYAARKGPAAYENLAYFEQEAITRFGHRHAVGLSGDLHTYARYASERGSQRFVSGGGGAYLYPSHGLPETLLLPTAPTVHGQPPEPYTLARNGPEDTPALFPDPATSRKLAAASLRFPMTSWKLSAVIGAVYLVLAWLLQSASKMLDASAPLLEALAQGPALEPTLGLFLDALTHAPLAFLVVLLLVGGLYAFADCSGARRTMLGVVHGAAHLAVVMLLMWTLAQVNLWLQGSLGGDPARLHADAGWHVALFAAEMILAGWGVGGLTFALYLFLSHFLMGIHDNEVFAVQSIPDYKHFLRLHIDREGALTIYPIGLRQVPRRWRYRPEAAAGEAWFEPEGTPVQERALLIEPPVAVGAGVEPYVTAL